MIDGTRLITCVVPFGSGRRILKLLRREEGITSAHLYHARGLGRVSTRTPRGVASGSARDVLEVMVESSRAEHIFERLYHEAGIDRQAGALLYEMKLQTATRFVLPEVPDEA